MQLKIGDTARMDEPVAMTIRFVDVPTDSRCPKGVTCVWEGDAEAVFEVRKGEESVEVGLHTHGGDQYPSHRTVAGYTLHLEALDPYPVEGRPLERSDYEATLKVTEEEEGTSGPVV